MRQYLDIKPEVFDALKNNQPVVALESTIISHGMPYPKNVETALNCEQIIRDNGAIPATIAIIDGKMKVGLTKEEITYLGKTGLEIEKASRRDLSHNLMKKIDSATTVSATMYIAALAGIKIFATGGIGGVHRDAENTMDISADLEELAQTRVLVVSAGAKSILDLGLTLEYLETKGVPVLGYKTKTLPAFYTSESDFEVNFQMDCVEDIAKLLKTHIDLNLPSGIFVANPIPKEFEIAKNLIDEAITNALIEAKQQGIKGKQTTPFLLAKVVELTKGKSLESNIKLVYNNCLIASKIACEYSKL